ncbi:MAG: hypothetical protein FJZ56_07510 [Chlamydiae bacterium]|nr:hypothetical protein [Chlamydiota bacterium]
MDNTTKSSVRPKKYVDNTFVKKERGRPKKYDIIEIAEEEIVVGSEVYISKYPKISKVDGDHLVRHLMSYFTRVVIIHHELSKHKNVMQPVFERLKHLDEQMTRICKELIDPV